MYLYGLGSALGPVEVHFLYIPLGALIVAGLLAVISYYCFRPTNKLGRVAVLIYTVPVTAVAGYATFSVGHMICQSTADHGYVFAMIHDSASSTVAEGRGVCTIFRTCLTNWRGQQRECDRTHQFLVLADPSHNDWLYTGGRILSPVWTQTDGDGSFNQGSPRAGVTLDLERGPVLSVGSTHVPLVDGLMISVQLGKNWEVRAVSRSNSPQALDMPAELRRYIEQCPDLWRHTAR